MRLPCAGETRKRTVTEAALCRGCPSRKTFQSKKPRAARRAEPQVSPAENGGRDLSYNGKEQSAEGSGAPQGLKPLIPGNFSARLLFVSLGEKAVP